MAGARGMAVALTALALLAGCSEAYSGSPRAADAPPSTAVGTPTKPPPVTTTTTPPRTTQAPAEAPKCTVNQFDPKGVLFDNIGQELGEADYAKITARLTMTNDFGPACTMDGFGGFSIETLEGEQIPTTLSRVDDGSRTKFTVPMGGRVAKDMTFEFRPDDGDPNAICHVATVGQVIVPDETDTVHVFMSDVEGFPAGICWGERITGGPYYPI